MTSILVTGSNGQLGSELRDHSAQHNSLTFHFTDIEELDITDQDAVKTYMTEYPVDYIINCAAYTQVDLAEDEVERAMLLNWEAVKNLVAAADETGARIIQISTDYVFPGNSSRPQTESNNTGPEGIYGLSKLRAEKELEGNSSAMIVRTSWLYSRYGKNFVKTMIALMKEREELQVVYDQIGSPTWANDLGRAILEIIWKVEDNTHDFVPGIYHYSNNGECSWFDFAIEIARLTESTCRISSIPSSEYPTKAKRPKYSVLDTSKIKSIYNLDIPFWRTSLAKCIKEIIQ